MHLTHRRFGPICTPMQCNPAGDNCEREKRTLRLPSTPQMPPMSRYVGYLMLSRAAHGDRILWNLARQLPYPITVVTAEGSLTESE